jgi:3-isopropylmalate/(R)-2-methylmalate dehydratase large subunit
MAPRTLYEKLWDNHIVHEEPGKPGLLYIDRHFVHESTSPQAFAGIRSNGRRVRRPELTFAVMDHAVPTRNRLLPLVDTDVQLQLDALETNCKDFNIRLFGLHSKNQGIVHIIGPELGISQPGQTIVCGDSHTSTHGALGALAFGIGTTEIEHVLATQCIAQFKARKMLVQIEGHRPRGVTAKDMILSVIAKIGVSGGSGCAIEFAGEAVRTLSMGGRMTICNMSTEAGARAGMISPDETTYSFLEGRPFVPRAKQFQEAVENWEGLATDPGAEYDRSVHLDAKQMSPMVSWGTNPGMVAGVADRVPDPDSFADPADQQAARLALQYMGLNPGTAITDIAIDRVFIGSCANARIGDLRAAAKIVAGRHISKTVRNALVVPGSRLVKMQAEKEGLDRIFIDAGFEWRDAGCSMCIAMNEDVLLKGERAASTSNRNFEGRQGVGSRTHLVSPVMAAAAAIEGHIVDVRGFSEVDGSEQ